MLIFSVFTNTADIANIRTYYDDSNQEVDEELKKAGKSDAEIASIHTNYDDYNQEVDEELKKAGKSEAEIASIGPHKVFKARGFTVN